MRKRIKNQYGDQLNQAKQAVILPHQKIDHNKIQHFKKTVNDFYKN